MSVLNRARGRGLDAPSGRGGSQRPGWPPAPRSRGRRGHSNCQPPLPVSDEDRAAQAKIAEHLAYLKQMTADGVVNKELALRARNVWLVAWISVGGELPVPAAAAFPGGPIEYHWAAGPHQLSAEVPTAGPCHWTYRNKLTGELWGAETPVDDGLPRRLVEYLIRIAASTR